MAENKNPMTRRSFVGLLAALGLGGPALADGPMLVVVHKDPNCGCCTGWVRHLRDAGFAVRVEETSRHSGKPGLLPCGAGRRLLGRGACAGGSDKALARRASQRKRSRGAGNADRFTRHGRRSPQTVHGNAVRTEGLRTIHAVHRQAGGRVRCFWHRTALVSGWIC
jgi:hypothetical protein